MLPKRIIYCWFGGKDKPENVQKCINTWKQNMPDWEYMEINESNFDINYNEFTKEAYNQKKWAFISDVARLWALYNYGGVYMDTDVAVYKPLDKFLKYDLFTGFEQPHYPVSAVLGANKGNKVIKEMLDCYNKDFELITNTVIMSDVLSKYFDRDKPEQQEYKNMIIFPQEVFTNRLKTQNEESYTEHLMFGSWL